MELEFHQLERRYEQLRASCPRQDRRILASLDQHGQQLPVVVVAAAEADRYVLVDGYRRVRSLMKLRHDTVRATCWDMSEQEALLLGRLMRTAQSDSALEQGWLLQELRDRFELSVEELARRFDRSPSWVSGRLGLVKDLPEVIQSEVRRGRLVPHAAMKFLLPLTRKSRQGAIELAQAIAPLCPSTRDTERLCLAYARGGAEQRRSVVEDPALVLRAREVGEGAVASTPMDLLLRDLGALAGIARRGEEHLTAGAAQGLLPAERAHLGRRWEAARQATEGLFAQLKGALSDAGRANEDDNPEAA